jgi:hypothetical protein
LSFAHVQGGGQTAGVLEDFVAVALASPVGAGHCLIASFGVVRVGAFAFDGSPTISDNQGNIWSLAATSPVQLLATSDSFQIFVYVAYNCAAGATTVTLTTNSGWGVAAVVDEYSGVAAAKGVDQITFASTVAGDGLLSVDSGSVTIPSGEMLYSAAFCDANGETFAPTAGFTTRETQNVTHPNAIVSLATFDALAPSSGSFSNTVTVSPTTPNSVHVVLLSLAAAPVTSSLVQVGVGATSASFATTIAASYPYPNIANNLLIAVARIVERQNFTISDTLGNDWVIVYGQSNPNPTFLLAYCLGCKGGQNTVTLVGNSGGSDVTLNLLLAEYTVSGASYDSSSQGVADPGTSVDTGDIVVSAPPALLVSVFIDSSNGSLPPVGSSPGTWRYQFSDGGFIQSTPGVIALADQTVEDAGSYDNVFTISPSDELDAAILGFNIQGSPPASHRFRPHIFAQT